MELISTDDDGLKTYELTELEMRAYKHFHALLDAGDDIITAHWKTQDVFSPLGLSSSDFWLWLKGDTDQ